MADFVLDLAEYSVRAALLLYLCKDNIMLKEKYRSIGRVLFFLQAFLVSFWLSNSEWVNRMLYGDETIISNSSYSIVKLAIAFLCSFVMMDVLYQGGKLAKIYLLSVYYTTQEMVRFMLHSFYSFGTTAYLNHINAQIIAGDISAGRYYELIEYMQFYALLAFSVGTWTMMYMIFRLYRRYQTCSVNELSREGIRFLMLVPVIGMAFDVLWRVTLFYQHGAEIEFLYDRHGSMYVVVPVIAALCLTGIVFSRKIYSELIHSEEQKNKLLFYKQQLSDMTDHVRELEQLYDGIKGMRHDINNYVADMEQLLEVCASKQYMSEQARQEAGRYLQSMQRAASELSFRFSTGNPVTDVILNRKGQICAQENIVLDGELLYPTKLGIEAFDMGILLNNALDNAIEACMRVSEDENRTIRFTGYIKGRMFFLVVENSYDGTVVRIEENGLRTTKVDEEIHGLGMSNMRSCVEKYYGTMQYELGEDMFILTIMLQGGNGL